MIVADLVATLSLDDQMSPALQGAGKQLDSLAARGGKSTGQTPSASQIPAVPAAKPYSKNVSAAFGYDRVLDKAARYSQPMPDARMALGGQAAAPAVEAAPAESLSGLPGILQDLATTGAAAAQSLAPLPGILREIASVAGQIKGGGNAMPEQDDVPELLEDLHSYLPGPLNDLAGLGILAYKSNLNGFADAFNSAASAKRPGDSGAILGAWLGDQLATGISEFVLGGEIGENVLGDGPLGENAPGAGGFSFGDALAEFDQAFTDALWTELEPVYQQILEQERALVEELKTELWNGLWDALVGKGLPTEASRAIAGAGIWSILGTFLGSFFDNQSGDHLEDVGNALDPLIPDTDEAAIEQAEKEQDKVDRDIGYEMTRPWATVPSPGLGGVPDIPVPDLPVIDYAALEEQKLANQKIQALNEATLRYLANRGELYQGTVEWDTNIGEIVSGAGGEGGPTGALAQRPSDTASDLMTGALDIQATAVTVTAQTTKLANAGPLAMPEPLPGATNEMETGGAVPAPGLGGVASPATTSAGGMGTQLINQWAQGVVSEINAAAPAAVAQIQAALQSVMVQVQAAMNGAVAAGGAGAGAAASPPATALPTTVVPPGMGPGGGAGGPVAPAGGGGAITSAIQQEMSAAASAAQSGGQQIATAMQSAATAAQTGAQQIVAAVQSIGPALSAAAANAGATAGTIGDAIVAALEADLGAVQAAAAALGSAAQAGLQSTVQPGSPSRMAIPYGQSIGEGLAFGMRQKSPEVLAAAEKLGYSAEQGLQPLMDGMSMTGLAAGKALGVDMEQALAQQVNGMEGWDPKSQIDHEALLAFQDAAVKMARYGKRAGDDAASKAGEAFQGLADNMSAVLMGSETYLSDELAKDALMAYRKLDAEAKAKLPDGIKEQLKATYDEANITIGDVIQQRMGGRLGEGMDLKGRFKEAKENILRGMLGQRTLEQKAQAAAEDGLSLAIDSIKSGLMQGGQDAQSAMKGAIDSALGGGPGEAMKGGMLESMFGGGAGADPEEFAWALCECISGANQEMLGSLGLGNPAETATAMLGHELSNQIAGTGDEFRSAMLDYAKQNPALNLPTQWLEDESASQCMTICDKTAQEMGGAAGDAAGAAMGAKMPAMPSGADFGKAAGGALGSQMQSQCVSLCGGTTDDLASGVANGVGKGVAEMGVEQVTGEMTSSGAREMGKQLRGSIPGATMPGMPGASPDDMASGVADGITGQCITLCDDSGMSDAAGSLDSAASGMSDLGGQISQLTQSLVSQKFGETMKGIQDGLSGGGEATGGIPAGVEVPEHIMKLNPNINRALNFDIAQTNPHAAALLGGASPVHLSGGGNPLSGGTPSGFQDSGEQTINVNLNVDGQTLANTSVKYMGRGLGLAMQNARRGGAMMGSRRG